MVRNPIRKSIGMALLFGAAATATACAYMDDDGFSYGGMKGDPIADYAGESFDSITLAGPDNIEFTTGEAYSMTASGDPDDIAKLRFEIDDGELTIGRKKDGWGMDSKPVTLSISAPSLRAMTIAGSGSGRIDRMRGDTVKLTIAGSGDLDARDIDTPDFVGSIAGSGDMKLAGKATAAKLSIAGSGNIEADEFSGDKVKVSVAGSGDMSFRSDGEVDASLVGSGDVRVAGSASCKSSKVGSGELSCG